MGKPYAGELDSLPETYAWALGVPLGDLPRALRAVAALPLIGVGSGGSFTTADFAAAIHRCYCSVGAIVMTPLEAVATPQSFRESAILLATAGGRNPDALGAFERLVEREPARFVVLCATTNSPLGRIATRYPTVDFLSFEPPSGKDGFLATNSLLTSIVVLIRAYADAFEAPLLLPERVESLLQQGRRGGDAFADFDQVYEPLWQRTVLVVLYGPDCHSAAVDLESKFTEAALGTVQLADFRNFAHGRHHWLAKRGSDSAVLAIVSETDRSLAETLLALLPETIPVVRLEAVGTGLTANLSALLQVFHVVGSAGKARRIDPGNPGVPKFGRKVYHLRAFSRRHVTSGTLMPAEAAAIERKARASVTSLVSRGTLQGWRSAFEGFCARLATASFRGIVLDYDGTLCSEAQRDESLSASISRQLNRLLRAGAILGVATGRGKSVKGTLRHAIRPQFWKRVVVGYYNGGDVATLADDARPNGTDGTGPTLLQVAEALRLAFDRSGLAKLTYRLPQITIEPVPGANREEVWSTVEHLIFAVSGGRAAAVRSSHSIDVLATGVTKRAVIDRVRQFLLSDAEEPILCVGDQGRWPGNDYALLSTPYSLSVNEVSCDPETCWNLGAPGRRGVPATLDYLERLTESGAGLQFSAEDLRSNR